MPMELLALFVTKVTDGLQAAASGNRNKANATDIADALAYMPLVVEPADALYRPPGLSSIHNWEMSDKIRLL